MNKTLIFSSIFLLLIFLAITIVAENAPKPIDWNENYEINKKSPYGLYVFNKEADKLFKNQKVSKFYTTPYEFFEKKYNESDSLSGTIFQIKKLNIIDDASLNEYLYFVSQGNTVFLSNEDFPKQLQDSLKFELIFDESIFSCNLTNQKFKEQIFIPKKDEGTHFSKIDTATTKILGYHDGYSKEVNFIKVQYGKGFFLLHTAPIAFTNISLLEENNYKYAENVLSYIPNTNIYWNLNIDNEAEDKGVLQIIFNNPPLKMAWYLFLIGIFVFILFNAKRRQRIVPILTPLENTTVEFAKTISNLYFQEKNYSDLINKKIVYFLDKLRTEYYLDTSKIDDDFIKKVQQKTGKDIQIIQHLFEIINNHRRLNLNSEKELIELNQLIDKVVNY